MNLNITYNAKPKKSAKLQAGSFEELKKAIYKQFNIEEGKITFMKPRLKDEQSFQKQIKEGSEILIMGTLKKEKEKEVEKPLTEEEIEREKEKEEKKKKKEEELQKMREEMKLNKHQKILKRLNEKGIKERGIEFFNEQTNQPQDLKIGYAIYPLYLLKFATEFKIYCLKYKCMQKNPDGLIIEEMGRMFREMDNSEGVICPLEWISGWICYCSDDIEYPYPTYSMDYFLNRTFSTMKMAFDIELEKKEEEPNSRVDCSTKYFGIQVLTRRRDITKLDEEDTQAHKVIDKKAMKYFFECDLSNPDTKKVLDGIRARFKAKTLWRNFYAFDIEYQEQIKSIERLPKYFLVQCSRWGYPPAHEEWQEIEFYECSKTNHTVRINRILDFYQICDNSLKDKLEQGRYERNQMFYPYHMDERFPSFCQSLNQLEMSEEEVKYQFLDYILFTRDIYHEFWFQPLKNSKPTGEYRLVGVVFHKGDYYHRPDDSHQHDCRGDFMAIAYKRGKDWVKYHGAEVQIVDINEATSQQYWGKEGGWTPILFMYRQIFMRNIQVQPVSEPRRDRNTTRRRR